MKGTKNKREKEVNEVVPEGKKSKILLFWEERERQGFKEGTILNMRAVLK